MSKENNQEGVAEWQEDAEFTQIIEFVPNNFAVDAIVKVHSIHFVASQFHHLSSKE
jgi:hypothetical protein